jgi:hypothetical protein
MLSWLEAHALVTARKRQLSLCGIARLGLRGPGPALGPLVSAAENLAGLTGQEMHRAEGLRAVFYDRLMKAHQGRLSPEELVISRLASEALNASKAGWGQRARQACEPGLLAKLLRDVFGSPMRKVRRVGAKLYHRVKTWPAERQPRDLLFVRDWLGWQDGLAVKMAQEIEEERAWEQMPILGDVLEEAGCAEERILGHLRGPGPHVRGCWVLGLILGKE